MLHCRYRYVFDILVFRDFMDYAISDSSMLSRSNWSYENESDVMECMNTSDFFLLPWQRMSLKWTPTHVKAAPNSAAMRQLKSGICWQTKCSGTLEAFPRHLLLYRYIHVWSSEPTYSKQSRFWLFTVQITFASVTNICSYQSNSRNRRDILVSRPSFNAGQGKQAVNRIPGNRWTAVSIEVHQVPRDQTVWNSGTTVQYVSCQSFPKVSSLHVPIPAPYWLVSIPSASLPIYYTCPTVQ